jgi:hypothetical protein
MSSVKKRQLCYVIREKQHRANETETMMKIFFQIVTTEQRVTGFLL